MRLLLLTGWAMVVVSCFIGGLVYAAHGHQWKALAMGLVCALVIVLRNDITEDP